MSGEKKIYITVSADEIDSLKEEIKDYIIDTVDTILAEKNLLAQDEKRKDEIQKIVHTTFKKGTEFSTGNTDRNNSTPQEVEIIGSLSDVGVYTVKEVCEAKKDGKWVPSAMVKVVDVDPTYDESHRILQRGVMVDLLDQWKFSFVIWRKSGLMEVENGEYYRLQDIVSSVYGDQVEMQLNSKSEVYEVDAMEMERSIDPLDLIG